VSRTRVTVEIHPETEQVLRIFRNAKAALSFDSSVIREMPRSAAVETIRRQVFEKYDYRCKDCGKFLVWERGQWNSGEMHEEVPRGKGGEISVTNSVLLCRGCHTQNEDSAHGNRRLHFGEHV
jgi:5-methylcytosine-specific restriction endonuclease McrA